MASTEELLKNILSDVKDTLNLGFVVSEVQKDYVPNYEDPGLTFGYGAIKKAKEIETCVLYADIRNSTSLSQFHSQEKMAKLYSSFVKSVLDIAEHHNGVVRNIIGDRVMVVFPANDCYTNAVDAAISINTVSTRIIDKHFEGLDFKVGIGIDHGDMLVIKAGIPKQDKERTNYKNLVWIGKPANIASKLTDVANKEIKRKVYRVTRNPRNPKSNPFPPFGGLNLTPYQGLSQFEPPYLSTQETIDLTPEEFAATLSQHSFGDKEVHTFGGKWIKFEVKEISEKTPAILMTEKVYSEFAKLNPARKDIKEQYWKSQTVQIKDYPGKVFGSDVYWGVMDGIK